MGIKTSVRNAANSVLKAIAPDSDALAETDILDTLKKEHDEVKSLLSDLQDANTASQRKSLVTKIKAALVPHTKAEEKVLYTAIIALKDKDAQVDGHEGFIEHDCASNVLKKLASIENATSSEHKAAAKVLKELVEHHIDEEESNVWSVRYSAHPSTCTSVGMRHCVWDISCGQPLYTELVNPQCMLIL